MHSQLVLSADELRDMIAAVCEYNGTPAQAIEFNCEDGTLASVTVTSGAPGLVVRTSSEGERLEDVARSFSERRVKPDGTVTAVG